MPVRRAASERKLLGKSIHSLDDFYDAMALLFHFPEYFGRNLDALWDLLATDVEGPVELFWEDSAISKKSMGKDFTRVSALLRDLVKERKDFSVTFR